jgi:hypothetical protein
MDMKLFISKYLYFYVLPLIWLLASILSYCHPGDEYAMYVISCIIGSWICFVVKMPDIHIHSVLFQAIISFTGAVSMIVPALILYKLKTNKLFWMILFALCVIGIFLLTIVSYPSIEKALSKNGSWWAYIASSVNIGLYLSILLSIMAAGFNKLLALCCKKGNKHSCACPNNVP